MITIPFWIGTIIACILMLGSGAISFLCHNSERKRKKELDNIYLDEAKIIENDAALIYEDICLHKQLFDFQSNVDIALLIALINNYDLKELTTINSVEIDDLIRVIGYTPEAKENVNFLIKEAIEKRIKELFDAEYPIIFVPINFQSIAISLEKQSDTVKKIIEKAKNEKNKIDNKETIFYNHNFTIDEKAKILKKTL